MTIFLLSIVAGLELVAATAAIRLAAPSRFHESQALSESKTTTAAPIVAMTSLSSALTDIFPCISTTGPNFRAPYMRFFYGRMVNAG